MNRIPSLQLNVLPISHLLVPLNVLSISHLLLLLLDVLQISHPIVLYLLELLYPKTPTNRSKARLSKWKRKRSLLHLTRTTQNRKRGAFPKTKTKQRRKKSMRPRNGNGMIKKSLWQKKKCTLEAEELINLDHDSTPFDIFQMVTGMNEPIESL